jgi:hypothetical protein
MGGALVKIENLLNLVQLKVNEKRVLKTHNRLRRTRELSANWSSSASKTQDNSSRAHVR